MTAAGLRNRSKKKKKEELKKRNEKEVVDGHSSGEESDDEGGVFRSNSGFSRNGVIVNSYLILLLLSSFLYFTHEWRGNTTDANFALAFALLCPIFARFNIYVTMAALICMLGFHLTRGFPEVEANTFFVLQYVATVFALLPEVARTRYRSDCLNTLSQSIGIILVVYFFFLGFHKLNSAWMSGTSASCALNTTASMYGWAEWKAGRTRFAKVFQRARLGYIYLPSIRHTMNFIFKWFCLVQPTVEFMSAAALFFRKGSRMALITASVMFFYYFYTNTDPNILGTMIPPKNFGILINFLAAIFLLCRNDINEVNGFKEYAWMGEFAGVDTFMLKATCFMFGITVFLPVCVVMNIIEFVTYTRFRTRCACIFYFVILGKHLFSDFRWKGCEVKPKSTVAKLLVLLSLLQYGGCYIGLSTAGNLSGKTNLLVEGGLSNHLLLGGGLKLFNFQEDTVKIIDFPDRWLSYWHAMPKSKRVHIGGVDHVLTSLNAPKPDLIDIDLRNRENFTMSVWRENDDGKLPRDLSKVTTVRGNSFRYYSGWSTWRFWFKNHETGEFLGPKRPMILHEQCPEQVGGKVCIVKGPLLEDGVVDTFHAVPNKEVYMTIPRIGFDKLLHVHMLRNYSDPADAIIPMRVEYGGEMFDMPDIFLSEEFSKPKYPFLMKLLDFKGWYENSTKLCDYY